MKRKGILSLSIKKIVFIAAAVSCLFVLTILIYAHTPIDDRRIVSLVEIPKGASFVKIVDILDQKGLVEIKPIFYVLAIVKGAARQIRAGEYEFVSTMTPDHIIDRLVRGEIKKYKVIIREDLTFRDIAAILSADEYKLVSEEAFHAAASDPVLLASLGITAATAEGYLFPETYFFDHTMNARDIITTMVHQFRKKVAPEMIKKAEKLGLTEIELITLASLIGKESGNKQEKVIISAVFHNRLKKGMKLQSDPTAIYDLWNFSGGIKRSHLKRKSPYNTYVIDRLPPGPIANPGIDSLEAAVNPAPVPYLYFVSQNDGTHYFSSNLSDHNEAALKFQMAKQK
ncbi:MAG: endolytic transglycosylase MltG [Deltaproteobacteria bacterium]|nr:endolytic transglycosylase MltG [Deltaproteobacteria bacterium]